MSKKYFVKESALRRRDRGWCGSVDHAEDSVWHEGMLVDGDGEQDCIALPQYDWSVPLQFLREGEFFSKDPEELIIEGRSLKQQLRMIETEDLKQLIAKWAGKWFGGRVDGAVTAVWYAVRSDNPGREFEAAGIAAYGRSIDAWITEEGKVVTIAEWEAMLVGNNK